MKKLIIIFAVLLFSLALVSCDFLEETDQPIDPDKCAVPVDAGKLKGINYEDAVLQLEDAGFSNIQTEKIEDLIIGWLTKDGEVEEVSIAGKTSFSKGDLFDKSATIIVRYHTFPSKDEPTSSTTTESIITTTPTTDKPTPVTDQSLYYTTNDLQTAKNGNSGVYSYKRSGQYDSYVILDFNEKYVYSFSNGNGETGCTRVKMVSGSLNDILIVTYHDGSSVWSEGYSFKYSRQPDRLIIQDSSPYVVDYSPADLKEALKIRDTKTIYDY